LSRKASEAIAGPTRRTFGKTAIEERLAKRIVRKVNREGMRGKEKCYSRGSLV